MQILKSGRARDVHASTVSQWDWRWPSLCRLDLKRTGSVGEPLTDCAQEWAVRKNSDEEMGLSR